MKPTNQFNEKSRHDSDDRAPRKGSVLPQIDYSFQAASVATGGGRGLGSFRKSFRAISQDYLQNEARFDFASEAALFSVIVITAALPMLSSANALVHLVRAFGTL